MCEINPFCQKVLRKHWPNIPIFSDVRELSKEVITNEPAIDIIYGGFPCQPFSVAGNKKGKDDTRYLWPEFSRLISDFKPRWILAENVPGILRIAADDVCSDLERQGYNVGIFDYEAASVGAKHRRERIFFVAHSGRSLLQRSFKQTTLPSKVAKGTSHKPERPGWRQSQSGMGRELDGFSCGLDGNISPTAHGIPHRTDRLKALGNAVVPQQVYPLFRAIIEADKEVQS